MLQDIIRAFNLINSHLSKQRFNLIIFIVSMRENEKAFLNSHQNVEDIVNIAH